MARASVLVIDEDQAMADVLTDALRQEGYVVSRVSSPDDAVALLVARGPGAFDLVLGSPFWSPCEEQHRYAWLPSAIMARDTQRAQGDGVNGAAAAHPGCAGAAGHARGWGAVQAAARGGG